MVYDALEIAEYIIDYCNSKSVPISNLKLQKILYFVQAEFLVSRDKPCFKDEIQAWDFGPVIPRVYRKYKIYGSGNIPSRIQSWFCLIDKSDIRLINDMTDQCIKYTASELVEITHHQSPWIDNYALNCHNKISNDEIKNYFKEIQ